MKCKLNLRNHYCVVYPRVRVVAKLRLIAVFVLHGILLGSVLIAHCQGPPSRSGALVLVDLQKLGWASPKDVSNHEFMKGINVQRIEALDDKTRVRFLGEDVIVVYHRKPNEKDGQQNQRMLEAFFIRVNDGRLLSTMTWPVNQRQSLDDRRDSEARIFPLSDGRFLVFAEGLMTLYGRDLKLEKQKTLDAFGVGDMWGVQIVAQGHEIFLRHQSRLGTKVTYSWLNADTLEVKLQQPGYEDKDWSVEAVVDAGDSSVFIHSQFGLRMAGGTGQSAKTICENQLCRGNYAIRALAPGYVGISSRLGIAIVSTDEGLAWSRSIESPNNIKGFQFGEMDSSMSGTKFGVWAIGSKKGLFDGIQIESSPVILVYDRGGLQDRPRAIPIKPESGDWNFALSPSGSKLAVFDGKEIQIHSIS